MSPLSRGSAACILVLLHVSDCHQLPRLDDVQFSSSLLQITSARLFSKEAQQAVELGAREHGSEEDGRKFFVWMTDLHMDSFYGQAGQQCSVSPATTATNVFGTMGCDPPKALLDSALQAAIPESKGAEFFAFTGDFMRHGLDALPNPVADVTGTVGVVANAIAVSFPQLRRNRLFALGTMGNDDSIVDYGLNITTFEYPNPWLLRLAWTLRSAEAITTQTAAMYAYGGYFEKTYDGLRILMINTIIYSVSHVPRSEDLPSDPFGQFSWLEGRLEEATRQGQVVWIMGHIPPGIETYGYTALWQPCYVERYLSIVTHPVHGASVGAQLFGHTHSDEFRILPEAPAGAGPVLLAGALSPVYRSQPSFRLVEYNATTGRLLGYKVYYANLTSGNTPLTWAKGYDLLETYPSLAAAVARAGALTSADFQSLLEDIKAGRPAFVTYAYWYKTTYQNDLLQCAYGELQNTTKERCRQAYACSLPVQTQAAYGRCAAPYLKSEEEIQVEVLPKVKEDDFAVYNRARLKHWLRTAQDVTEFQKIIGQLDLELKA